VNLRNFGNAALGSTVHVVPYVLPSPSELSPEQEQLAAGPRGWVNHQGFYIYRNRRLLVMGGWLGIRKRDPQFLQARVLIEIDNRLDDLWQIDIRKARAHVPDEVRDRLRSIADRACQRAAEAHRQRVLSTRVAVHHDVHPVWNVDQVDEQPRLTVNREHPMVQALRDALGADASRLDALLSVLASTIPTGLLQQWGQQQRPAPPPAPQSDLEMVTRMAVAGMRARGRTTDEIRAVLGAAEPWSSEVGMLEKVLGENA
jgi:hypothetical protein